jgi:CDP-glycerol glycerophosphotransferase
MFKKIMQWSINIFLKLLKFKKRNPGIWLFGSWGGDRYSDNSKYLFEYVVKNLPQINAVWITNNNEICKELNNKGLQSYLSQSLKGRKLRLEAKYNFFTNGSQDFGDYDLSQGAIKVALWHGMPLKKIGYAANVSDKTKSFSRLIKYYYLKIYNSSQRDFTIATSDFTKELLVQSFEVNPKTVFITGQPRNDVLFDTEIKNKIKKELAHKGSEKFVLYMPTWREFGSQDSFLDNIILKIQSDSEFNSSLADGNIKLYIKPHPRITITSRSQDNIIIISKSELDVQELITAADELITDYSSVFIDYALLDRPIHFFVPDLDEYKNSSTGLFVSFEKFSDYIFSDLEIFKKVILGEKNYTGLGRINSQKINSLFNDNRLNKGQYCENVIDTLESNKVINLRGKRNE